MMKYSINYLLGLVLLFFVSCKNENVYYIPDIETYVSVQKTQKGCFVSFDKNKVRDVTIKKRDFVLVPNLSNLIIVYDSINKNNIHIYSVEEFNTRDAIIDFNEVHFKLDLYSYSKTNVFFKTFYDAEKKKYKEPFKIILAPKKTEQ